MTKRDYFIIFCLLLPFFITLPLLLMKNAEYNAQNQTLELTRDTLHMARVHLAKALPDLPLEARPTSYSLQSIGLTPELAAKEKISAPKTSPAPSRGGEVMPISEPEEISQPKIAAPTVPEVPPAEPTPKRPEPSPVVEAPAPVIEADTAEFSPPAPVDYVEQANLLAATSNIRDRIADMVPQGMRGHNYRLTLRTPAAVNKAPSLKLDFNLNGVPPELRGNRPLYLVITNERTGDYLPGMDGIKASIPINGVELPIYAAARNSVTLSTNQRVSFERKLPATIPAGNYLLETYSDFGLVGIARFSVTAPGAR